MIEELDVDVADEPELARRSGQGPTFVELYEFLYRPMVRLAHLIVGSTAIAEELVQDAFMKMHAKWAGLEQPGAYVRVAVVNGCRSHLRRRQLERAYMAPVASSVEQQPDELWDAMGRLSFRRRAALALRYYEDMTEAEIARCLGCRPGTVKSLLHRALTQLRKEILP